MTHSSTRLSKISSASPRAEATGVVLYLRRERKDSQVIT